MFHFIEDFSFVQVDFHTEPTDLAGLQFKVTPFLRLALKSKTQFLHLWWGDDKT